MYACAVFTHCQTFSLYFCRGFDLHLPVLGFLLSLFPTTDVLKLVTNSVTVAVAELDVTPMISVAIPAFAYSCVLRGHLSSSEIVTGSRTLTGLSFCPLQPCGESVRGCDGPE